MFVDTVEYIYIAMPMYNLTEYSDNYSDTPGTLWQFKRDELLANKADLTMINFQSFKYIAALVVKTVNRNDGQSSVKDAKIVLPLKYLSNFCRFLEIPLINCKVYLELNWIENCFLSSAGNSVKFKITDAKWYIPIVTLFTKDSVNFTKQLSEWFKKPAYWNSYQTKPALVIKKGTNI